MTIQLDDTQWETLRCDIAAAAAKYERVAELYAAKGDSAADVVEALRLRDKASGLRAALKMMQAVEER